MSLQLKKGSQDENVLEYIEIIKQKLQCESLPAPCSTGALLRSLAHEVNSLKEELLQAKISGRTIKDVVFSISSE